MGGAPWLTIQFVAGQRLRDAIYVRPVIANPDDEPESWTLAGADIIRKPVVGSLVQHRIDQEDGVPMESRVLLAIEDRHAIVSAQSFGSEITVLLDVVDRDEEPDAEAVEELAQECLDVFAEKHAQRLEYRRLQRVAQEKAKAREAAAS